MLLTMRPEKENIKTVKKNISKNRRNTIRKVADEVLVLQLAHHSKCQVTIFIKSP